MDFYRLYRLSTVIWSDLTWVDTQGNSHPWTYSQNTIKQHKILLWGGRQWATNSQTIHLKNYRWSSKYFATVSYTCTLKKNKTKKTTFARHDAPSVHTVHPHRWLWTTLEPKTPLGASAWRQYEGTRRRTLNILPEEFKAERIEVGHNFSSLSDYGKWAL